MLAPVAWDAGSERAAAIWLARKLGRALLRLTDGDYRANSLQVGALSNMKGVQENSWTMCAPRCGTCKGRRSTARPRPAGGLWPGQLCYACTTQLWRELLPPRLVIRGVQGLLEGRGPVEAINERVHGALLRTLTSSPGTSPPAVRGTAVRARLLRVRGRLGSHGSPSPGWRTRTPEG